MYIPKYFEQKDIHEIFDFIQTYNFGIVISFDGEKSTETHLPFVAEIIDGKIRLYSHLSKANKQYKYFSEEKDTLIIFSEPHSYISPTMYEHQQNVPTWNYIAVHLYGKITLSKNDEEKLGIINKQIAVYESEYKKQFDQLDKKYIDELLKGIESFTVHVENIQCQEKLSQNKTAKEKQNIQQHLSASSDKNLMYLANKMKQ